MISEEIVHINGIPKNLIIFLHGYQDIAEYIDHKTEELCLLRDVAIHIPQAPFVNEIDPLKRQWFSIHRFDPEDKRRKPVSWDEFLDLYNQMTVGLEEARHCISEYADALLDEYGLGYENLFLCGFSQGAMCAVYSGLMCPHKIGGVVSFSGILAAKGFIEKHFQNTPDCLLLHGDMDDKIRIEALDFMADNLKKLGCNVEKKRIANMAHKVAAEAVSVAKDFIQARLK